MIALIKRARRGDTDAFVALMEACKMDMYKVAKSYLKREEDIADVMQDTVLSAFEHLSELKQDTYFKTWLIRILINRCNDILKERKRCEVQEAFTEVGYMDANQSNVEFNELIASLTEDCRVIMLLYYGEGFNAREIGEILEVSENTVKSKLRRSRMKLRNVLQN